MSAPAPLLPAGLALALLGVACDLPGAPDRLLERRGFPQAGAANATPPACEAPACWRITTPPLGGGLAPDAAGGLSGLTWHYGGEVRDTAGSSTLPSPDGLLHFDTDGVFDRFEPVAAPELWPGDAGGLLFGAAGEFQGETLPRARALIATNAEWARTWRLDLERWGGAPLVLAYGAAEGGALLVAGPGDTVYLSDGTRAVDPQSASLSEQAVLIDVSGAGTVAVRARAPALHRAALDGEGTLFAWVGGEPLADGTSAPEPPLGMDPVAAVLAAGADGALRWQASLALTAGVGVNFEPGPVAGSPEGGAWLAFRLVRPVGGAGGAVRLSLGGRTVDVPQVREEGTFATAGVVRITAEGEVGEVAWPWPAVQLGPGEQLITEIDALVTDGSSGVFVSGLALVYRLNGPSGEPVDAGPVDVAGVSTDHSGAFLAHLGGDGRGRWAVSHDHTREVGGARLAFDGQALFVDGLGPDFPAVAGGPGGNLLRWPIGAVSD